MKRPVLTALFLCAVAVLPGCPIYDHGDNGCYRSSDCDTGYACDTNSGECYLPSNGNSVGSSCHEPSDCVTNTTCSRAGECVAGDCYFSGCVSGYTCSSSSGLWACVSNADLGGAGAAGFAAAGAAGSETSAGSGGAAGVSGAAALTPGGAAGAN
jgi:hypothetical protein